MKTQQTKTLREHSSKMEIQSYNDSIKKEQSQVNKLKVYFKELGKKQSKFNPDLAG